MKANIPVSALIITFLCAALGTGCVCKKDPDRYYDPGKRFSVRFPKDWEISEGVKGTVVMAEIPSEDGMRAIRENVNIIVEDLGKDMRVSEYFQRQMFGLKKLTGAVTVMRGTSDIDGADARWFIYSYRTQSLGFRSLVCVFVKGRQGYVITCLTEEDTFEQYADQFDEILKSFRFE